MKSVPRFAVVLCLARRSRRDCRAAAACERASSRPRASLASGRAEAVARADRRPPAPGRRLPRPSARTRPAGPSRLHPRRARPQEAGIEASVSPRRSPRGRALAVPGGVVGRRGRRHAHPGPAAGPGARHAPKVDSRGGRSTAVLARPPHGGLRPDPRQPVPGRRERTRSRRSPIDVDTASYANVRRFLDPGPAPAADAVRIEELLNYFRYDYAEPARRDALRGHDRGRPPAPGSPSTASCASACRAARSTRRACRRGNLAFLLDVSGSMDEPEQAARSLKQAMGLLVESLREQDRVAIVVYAGSSGLVLPPTSGDRKAEIRDALDSPRGRRLDRGRRGHPARLPGGRRRCFLPGGVNRVILATDGDFNVGITSLRRPRPASSRRSAGAASSSPSSASARATSRTPRWRSWPTAATATTPTSTAWPRRARCW